MIFSALCAATAAAGAVSVEVTQPGTLRDAVDLNETSLTVTGSIDAADFDFIRELTSLQSLDLSGAVVAAYDNQQTNTANGAFAHPADILPEGALLSLRATTVTLPAGITAISTGAMGNCRAEALVIPATVTEIGTAAFAEMPNLKSITIPATVSKLGKNLFHNCPELTEVTILAPVKELPEGTFANCPKLQKVTLPASLEVIGESTFAGDKALEAISLPASLREIGAKAFAMSGLKSVSLENLRHLTSVGDFAFAACGALERIDASDIPCTFGKGAFFSASSFSMSLGQLAANATEIPDYLLYGTGASAAGFENTPVTKVGAYALSGLKDKEITLPGTLEHLGDHAMERLPEIQKIDATLLKAIPSLGESVWANVDQPNTVLMVPNGLLQTYKDAPQWQDFNVSELSAASVITPDEDITDNLRAAFDGSVLHVLSTVGIRSLQLYDVAGRCLTISNNTAPLESMAVDTAPFDTSIFLLRLLRTDGSMPVLKLKRP